MGNWKKVLDNYVFAILSKQGEGEKMRLGELTGKEVINLGDGAKLGTIDECELSFDSKTGFIEAILLPNRVGIFNLFGESRVSFIPWRAIRRIGNEVIIVDLNNVAEQAYLNSRRLNRRDTY